MTLKLNGSTAGSVSLDAPASTTGNADIALTLPVADGSNGQVLQTNCSGALSFATPTDTDTKWVYGTAADYDQWGSTTDVEFSGWPTNWQQIRISFIDISINANAYVQFFVSKSTSTSARISLRKGLETESGDLTWEGELEKESSFSIVIMSVETGDWTIEGTARNPPTGETWIGGRDFIYISVREWRSIIMDGPFPKPTKPCEYMYMYIDGELVLVRCTTTEKP